jgi:hypothetical protein
MSLSAVTAESVARNAASRSFDLHSRDGGL